MKEKEKEQEALTDPVDQVEVTPENENKTEEHIEAENKTVESDNPNLVLDIKAEYEKKLKEQATAFTEQIAKRDDIIKQLLIGDKSNANDGLSFIDNINASREAQNKY